MSVLVKASSDRTQAFKRGFWRGLGSAGTKVLVTPSPQNVFDPQPIPSRKRGDVTTDWQQVGLCMSEAMAISTPMETSTSRK